MRKNNEYNVVETISKENLKRVSDEKKLNVNQRQSGKAFKRKKNRNKTDTGVLS